MQAVLRHTQARRRRDAVRSSSVWARSVAAVVGELFALISLVAGLMAGLGGLAVLLG